MLGFCPTSCPRPSGSNLHRRQYTSCTQSKDAARRYLVGYQQYIYIYIYVYMESIQSLVTLSMAHIAYQVYKRRCLFAKLTSTHLLSSLAANAVGYQRTKSIWLTVTPTTCILPLAHAQHASLAGIILCLSWLPKEIRLVRIKDIFSSARHPRVTFRRATDE
jgi:hypothetical protein